MLAADVAAGKLAKPDLVIWPENSSDIDPLRNADAAAQIERAAQAVDVPILVGGVLQNPDGRTTSNSALVWEPGVGVVERADKRRVQPFGEYMPWREFFRLFSSYVDRAGYFVPGTGPGRRRHGGHEGRRHDLLGGRVRRPRRGRRSTTGPRCSRCRATTRPSASPR